MCEHARKLGLPLRLVGRRREALQALAADGDEVRVADARDAVALGAALEGAAALASLVGPFLELGFAPVEAALEAGVHYVDSNAEQPFARAVYERYGGRAAERDVVLLTSFGFDYAVGDFAARLAAEGLEPLDELVVAYAVERMAPSAGTRRTLGHILAHEQVAYENGGLVRSRLGATTRRIRFRSGEADAIEWWATEPLTVPRHTRVRTVRSYVRAPRAAARVGPLARLASPLVRAAGGLGPSPSARRRQRARFEVVAEASGPSGGRRVSLGGNDVYALTGALLARGVAALRGGEARGAGALAPAEAFEARSFTGQLEPLLRIEAVEEL